MFSIYVNHFSAQFPLVAVHYILNLKKRTLKQVFNNFQHYTTKVTSTNNFNHQVTKELQQIKLCAEINDATCKLISFPLIVFLFSNTLDSIGSVCAAKIYFNLSILFYQSAIFGYFLHLAHLEKQSRLMLWSISNFQLPLFKTIAQPSLSLSNTVKLKQLVEVYSYKLYFYLHYSFTLSLALFILNYSVLVLQTV